MKRGIWMFSLLTTLAVVAGGCGPGALPADQTAEVSSLAAEMVNSRFATQAAETSTAFITIGETQAAESAAVATLSAVVPTLTATFTKTPTVPLAATATLRPVVTATSAPNLLSLKPTQASQQGNCDDSYPDVCIPPWPPDLDCPDIDFNDFTVLSPDPHGFDRDNDGVGCES